VFHYSFSACRIRLVCGRFVPASRVDDLHDCAWLERADGSSCLAHIRHASWARAHAAEASISFIVVPLTKNGGDKSGPAGSDATPCAVDARCCWQDHEQTGGCAHIVSDFHAEKRRAAATLVRTRSTVAEDHGGRDRKKSPAEAHDAPGAGVQAACAAGQSTGAAETEVEALAPVR